LRSGDTRISQGITATLKLYVNLPRDLSVLRFARV
jgi:hypothetical protein